MAKTRIKARSPTTLIGVVGVLVLERVFVVGGEVVAATTRVLAEAFFHLWNGTHDRTYLESFLQRTEDFSESQLFDLCADLSDAVDDREFPFRY